MAHECHRKVYLVDDDESLRKAISRLLRAAGIGVETFRSARSFLDSVPLHDTEGILLLDLRMPGMDGFDLLKNIGEFHSPLKVIILTGDARPGDRDRALQMGAVGFLLKPFDEDSLLELLKVELGSEEDGKLAC
jgi:FixJ family two-component response regulator